MKHLRRQIGRDKQTELARLPHRDRIIVGPGPARHHPRDGGGPLLRQVAAEKLTDEVLDLLNRLLGHISQDQRLVVEVLRLLAGHRLQDRRRGILPQLGIHRPQDGVFGHDDLVGRQGDQRAAAHRVVRDEYRNPCWVAGQGVGDLLGGQDQTAGRMQDEVDRHRWIGQLDRPQDLLRVVNIDVAGDREAKQAHGLLAVDQADDPALPPGLEAAKRAQALPLEPPLADDRLDRTQDKKDPEEIENGHSIPPCPSTAPAGTETQAAAPDLLPVPPPRLTDPGRSLPYYRTRHAPRSAAARALPWYPNPGRCLPPAGEPAACGSRSLHAPVGLPKLMDLEELLCAGSELAY